jgi:hypothetical protein
MLFVSSLTTAVLTQVVLANIVPNYADGRVPLGRLAMRNFVFFLISTVTVAGLTATFVVWRSHAQSSGRTPVKFAKRETVFRYPTGDFAEIKETACAINRNGVQVEIRHPKEDSGTNLKIIVNPITKTRIVADDITRSVTTTYLSDPSAAKLQQKPTSCTEDPNPEHSTLLGYDVLKVVDKVPSDSGKMVPIRIRTESWVSPELDCLALKRSVYVTKDGPEVLTNLHEITNLVVGDPDPSLFAVPAGYTERSPSAVMSEYNRLHPEAPGPLAGFDGRDAAYERQQKK